MPKVTLLTALFAGSGLLAWGQTCDFGPSYAAATWTCAGGAAAGTPCSAPGDGVCVGGSCQVGTGGRASFYSYQGVGACGLGEPPPGVYVAAVATPDWAGSAACGTCLEVSGPLGSIVVKVVDHCPAGTNTLCVDGGHLDLDADAFAAVANPQQGIVEVDWRTVPCDWPGNVRAINKDGVNPFWYAVFIDDHRHAVASVEMRDAAASQWTTAERQAYNAFLVQDSGGLTLPLSLRVTDVTGAIVEAQNVITSLGEFSEFDLGEQLAAYTTLELFRASRAPAAGGGAPGTPVAHPEADGSR